MGGKLDMRAFFDGWTTLGQPLSMAAVLMRICVAVVIGAVIGIDREIKNRPAGMRTHVLVCVGAALVSLIECHAVADTVALGSAAVGVSLGRITTSVVSGVGFLGAGSIILTGRKRVKGLTTAAGLWASACLGLAIGAGYYECVAVSVALILVCMYAFPALENRLIQRSRYMNILAELDGMECLGGVLAALREQGVTVFDIDLSKQPEDRRAQLGVHLSVYLPKGLNHTELLAQLAALGGTVSIEKSQ